MAQQFLIFNPENITIDNIMYDFNIDLNEAEKCDSLTIEELLEHVSLDYDTLELEAMKQVLKSKHKKTETVLDSILESLNNNEYRDNNNDYYYIDFITIYNNIVSLYSYTNPMGLYDYVYEDTLIIYDSIKQYITSIKKRMTENNASFLNYTADVIILDYNDVIQLVFDESIEKYEKQLENLFGNNPLGEVLYHY